jgi:DNA topoisomerase-1
MKLVIVESPAKCSKIKGFLGDDYKVIASMGHIRALESDLEAVGINKDFEPKFTFMKEKAKAIADIKASMKGCSQVYLAADDDREGEAIAYSVCLLLGLDPTATPRAVFREITKKAVVEAVTNPRRLDMNKVFAQQSRAMLDMLIGFTLSPLLWKHVGRGLSAGRCQTPALRLIADKEKSITDFKSSLVWKISGIWKDMQGNKVSGSLVDELEDEESAKAYLEIVRDATDPYIVKDITVRPWKTGAPLPLITSTLQQQASAAFGMSPKVTMQVAQHLYEEGYITYMRTDCAVLSEEAATEGRKWIEDMYGSEYIGSTEKKAVDTKKKVTKKEGGAKATEAPKVPEAQEAHEAIRPTEMSMKTLPDACTLGAQEIKLYGLIWRRALQSLMSDARGETKTAKYQSESDPEFEWASRWSRTLFPGWKKLGEVEKIADDSEDDDTDDLSWNDTIKVGDKLVWTEVSGKAVKSTAPTRYTEASIVRELEKRGIGRPSTYASILGSLSEKNYIEIKDIAGTPLMLGRLTLKANKAIDRKEEKIMQGGEKKKMVPTDLGLRALEFLEKEFSDLIDYSFTAHMEQSLDKIALGQDNWKNVLRSTWASYSVRYHHFMNKKLDSDQMAAQKEANASAKVKYFGEYKAVMSKKGPLLLKENSEDPTKSVFYGWPDKLPFSDMTDELAESFIGEQQAKKEEAKASGGSTLIKQVGSYIFKNGPYGPYMYNDKLKTKTFIGIGGTDISEITVAEADKLYKDGVAKKKAGGGYKKFNKNKKE